MTGPQDLAAAGGDRLRASHADREQVIEALQDAFVQGRPTRTSLPRGRAGRWPRGPSPNWPRSPPTSRPQPGRSPAADPGAAISPGALPLARKAVGSGSCLIIAAVAARVAGLVDPGPPAPSPYHSWAPLCLFVAFAAVVAALLILVLGVDTPSEETASIQRG
jgi:hypothetical protein